MKEKKEIGLVMVGWVTLKKCLIFGWMSFKFFGTEVK